MFRTLQSLGRADEKHSAYQVRTGMMIGAIEFFKEIGWVEFEVLKVSGDWGQARFVSATSIGSHIFQLTEISASDPEALEITENHIALHFSLTTPKVAAETILEWANYTGAGEGSFIEPANFAESKWFVYLPALFRFAIELV